ncbi:MAG: ABC transporter substrate-binding protein, partial [Chloroflexota bacterium]|nr:ABC transporter substrate-binding protein [Chloroflexota bacterium]
VWRMALTGNPTAYPITTPGQLVDILVNKTIYNNLVKYQLNGNALSIVPDLAESWEANGDLTEYTFKVRQGVKWHDGQPLTAADVKFSFDAYLDPKNNSPRRGTISAIREVQAPDERTVKFLLQSSYAPLPVVLGYNVPIVPKHLLEGKDLAQPADFIARPVGSGPFKFKRYETGSYLEVERYDDYFSGKPSLDGIVFKILPDSNAQVAQLKSGDLDFAVISPPQVETLRGTSAIEVREAPQVQYFFFAINHTNPVWKEPKVRQAFAHATDRQAIVDNLLKGSGRVATGPISPLLAEFYNGNVERYPYNLDRANVLLDEAGWRRGVDGFRARDGQRLSLVLEGPKGYPVMEQVMTFAQQEFSKLGAEIKLELDDWNVHLSRYRAGQYGLLMEWWITPPDPDLFDHYHSTSGSNYWKYNNPEVDALIMQGRAAKTAAERTTIYKQLQDVLARDLPVIFLYYPQELQALSRRTQGFPLIGYRDALSSMQQVSLR